MAIPLRSVPQTTLGDVRIDGGDVAVRVLNAAPGAIAQVFTVAFADAATNSVNIVMTEQMQVIDVIVLKTAAAAAAANTVTVLNEGNAITDAIVTNIADKAIARASTIDDAFHDVIVGAALRVTNTKAGGNSACIVKVLCMRSA